MKVGILYFADSVFGLGHHYRCTELARRLEKFGHDVYIFSNLQFRRKMFFQLRPHNEIDLYHILHQCQVDWLIVDTPYYPDDFIFGLRDKFDFRILYLNADKDYPDVDVSIVHGFLPGKYSGTDWIILRENLEQYRTGMQNDFWFVFGGSADEIGLLPYFTRLIANEGAYLVGSPFTEYPETISENHMILAAGDDAAFLGMMSSCKRACISFGLTVWELIYYDVPTYAFSLTEDHLNWALAADNEGLIKAYPEVGLPDENAVIEFLHKPFEIAENSLDLEGATRIVRLMESYE